MQFRFIMGIHQEPLCVLTFSLIPFYYHFQWLCFAKPGPLLAHAGGVSGKGAAPETNYHTEEFNRADTLTVVTLPGPMICV